MNFSFKFAAGNEKTFNTGAVQYLACKTHHR